jgi:hypothetical protein
MSLTYTSLSELERPRTVSINSEEAHLSREPVSLGLSIDTERTWLFAQIGEWICYPSTLTLESGELEAGYG